MNIQKYLQKAYNIIYNSENLEKPNKECLNKLWHKHNNGITTFKKNDVNLNWYGMISRIQLNEKSKSQNSYGQYNSICILKGQICACFKNV